MYGVLYIDGITDAAAAEIPDPTDVRNRMTKRLAARYIAIYILKVTNCDRLEKMAYPQCLVAISPESSKLESRPSACPPYSLT